ncbi:MAG: metalloregulator ArsR/SmtB family transcription factor [Planctomycetes bacterium]|nr:metalloregulator ArsR/SmtB family transcription factor [Planctomycetota bacterium]
MFNTLNDLVGVFKLLSDETRLRILYFLTRRPELHVRALCDLLEQSQPAVSHHLALLRAARLVSLRREGKHNFYSILPDRIDWLRRGMTVLLPEGARRAADQRMDPQSA